MSADTEVRVTSATGGQKGKKAQQIGTIDPLALLALAEVSGFGAQKYEAYNYLKGYDWSLSYDAAQRHMMLFWAGEDYDEESGLLHPLHAAWHMLATASFIMRELGTDDRFKQEQPVAKPSIFQPLLDIQDRINQRYAAGIDRGPSNLWTIPDETKFGTFKPELSAETPDPVGCIVTVTGDEGISHGFTAGDPVEVVNECDYLFDGSYDCRRLSDGLQQWVSEVDLA